MQQKNISLYIEYFMWLCIYLIIMNRLWSLWMTNTNRDIVIHILVVLLILVDFKDRLRTTHADHDILQSVKYWTSRAYHSWKNIYFSGLHFQCLLMEKQIILIYNSITVFLGGHRFNFHWGKLNINTFFCSIVVPGAHIIS